MGMVENCNTCGEPLETDGIPTLCKCERDNMEAQALTLKEQAEKEAKDSKRRGCFKFPAMYEKTFSNAYDKEDANLKVCADYVRDFRRLSADGLGLLLYGPVGTGKSYLAACVANALIDVWKSVKFTTIRRVADDMARVYGGKTDFLDALCRYDLVVIDDFGASEGMTPAKIAEMFQIVDALYESGTPVIYTTNMDIETMKHEKDVRLYSIYSRIIERCRPINVNGKDKRIAESARNAKKFKAQ